MKKLKSITLQNLLCCRCGKPLVISKFQSNVRQNKITGYCFDQSHVYSPVKIMTVNKIRLQLNVKRKHDLNEKYNMKNMKCIICGNEIYFDKHSSFQIGSKIVGDCLKNGHRIELTMVAKVVNEPDCREIIQVKLKESSYGL